MVSDVCVVSLAAHDYCLLIARNLQLKYSLYFGRYVCRIHSLPTVLLGLFWLDVVSWLKYFHIGHAIRVHIWARRVHMVMSQDSDNICKRAAGRGCHCPTRFNDWHPYARFFTAFVSGIVWRSIWDLHTAMYKGCSFAAMESNINSRHVDLSSGFETPKFHPAKSIFAPVVYTYVSNICKNAWYTLHNRGRLHCLPEYRDNLFEALRKVFSPNNRMHTLLSSFRTDN